MVVPASLEAIAIEDRIIEQVYIDGKAVMVDDALIMGIKNEKVKNPSIAFDINTSFLANKTYYLVVTSDLDSLYYSNVEYIKRKNTIYIKLDKNTHKKLYFKYHYEQKKRLEFRSNIIESYEYDYILPFEGILYGVAYGIIFSAFLYYIFIYFSTYRNAFLYYSLMQLNVLLSLICFVMLSDLPYPPFTLQAFTDTFETLSFLFTLLFAKEILNTKENMKYINITLNFFVLLNLLDIVAIILTGKSVLYEYMPFYVIFLLTAIAGIFAIWQKNYNAIVYTLGWFLVFLTLYLWQKDLIPISGIYAIHLVAPLESLIFSFALVFTLKQIINEKNENEKLLIHKSKLASMGEMINNIAHQWRQPLMNVSCINMNLQLASDDNELDKKYLDEKLHEVNEQLDFMSQTINNFIDFYKPTKEKAYFSISGATKKSIDIMKPILDTHKITLEFKVVKDKKINAYENEYSQVILNLISNAKDALLSKKVESPKIVIQIDKDVTRVCDNAGGIEEEYINKIFEPYFSTKENGSGIGLYMSKMIMESHFKGALYARNTLRGACFYIRV